MPVTVEELKKAIRQEFPSADVGGIVEKDHRVTGTIVWKGFKNKQLEERHDVLEQKVLDKLGMKGINIGMLFPLAPGEKLQMLNRAIIEDALHPIRNAPVGHYTRIGTLCHFISAGAVGWASAWATPVQFLNDRKELSLGEIPYDPK